MTDEPKQRDAGVLDIIKRSGCLLPLAVCAWIYLVRFWVPIGADRYRATLSAKLVVTFVHLVAVFALLRYPYHKRSVAQRIGGAVTCFLALMDLLLLWTWNL